MISIKGGRKLGNVASSTNNKIKSVGDSSSKTLSPVGRQRTEGTSKILTFGSKNVQVIKRAPDGTVSLLVKCEVDIIEAMQSEVNMLGVTFEPQKKDLDSTSQSQVRTTPRQVLENILYASSEASRKRETALNNVVVRSFIDITAYIDNSIAKILTKSGKKAALAALGTEIVVSMESPRSNKQIASQVPVLQTPSSKMSKTEARSEVSVKQLMSDLILKDGKSPMSIFKPRVTYASTEKSLAGTITSQPELKGRAADLLSIIIDGPIRDLDSASNTPSDTSDTDDLPVLKRLPKEKIEVHGIVKLTKSQLEKLGNNAVVKISAFGDPNSSAIDNVGCDIDIATKLTHAFNNAEPLEENAAGTGLRGRDKLTQDINDNINGLGPAAGSSALNSNRLPGSTDGPGQGGSSDVDLYIDPINPSQPYDGGGWKPGGILGQGSYGSNIGGLRSPGVNSNGETPGIVGGGQRGFSPLPPTLGTFVVPQPTRHLAAASSYYGPKSESPTDNKFVSIGAFLRTNGITIRVENFQGEYSVGVLRRDKTINEKKFSFLNIKEPIQPVTENSPPVTFVDTNVKDNHIYEYRVKIFTKTGREIVSTANTTIKYQKLNDNILKIQIGQPKMTIDASGNVDIQFDIFGDISDSNISAITTLLQERNLESYFSDDILENRERLKDLIVFGVERTDLTRGVTEDFGIFTGTGFSDVANQTLNNVSPLRANRDYRYVVTGFLRTPDTMIATATRSSIDKKTNLSYTFSPAKYLHPATLSNSTLRSPTTIEKSDFNEEFKAGFSGAQVFVDVTTKTAKPDVVSGHVITNERENNEIRWKIKGNASQIKMFIIVGDQLGMRSIVGNSHPITSNNSFMFEDRLLSKHVGSVIYSVIPVFTDMTMGKEFKIGTATSKKLKRLR